MKSIDYLFVQIWLLYIPIDSLWIWVTSSCFQKLTNFSSSFSNWKVFIFDYKGAASMTTTQFRYSRDMLDNVDSPSARCLHIQHGKGACMEDDEQFSSIS